LFVKVQVESLYSLLDNSKEVMAEKKQIEYFTPDWRSGDVPPVCFS